MHLIESIPKYPDMLLYLWLFKYVIKIPKVLRYKIIQKVVEISNRNKLWKSIKDSQIAVRLDHEYHAPLYLVFPAVGNKVTTVGYKEKVVVNYNENGNLQSSINEPLQGSISLINRDELHKIGNSIYQGQTTLYEGRMVPHGYGTRLTDDSCYKGEYKYGKFEGHGTIYADNEIMYSGSWKNGKLHGTAFQIWSNRMYHYGLYENGIRKGPGILMDAGQRMFIGTWANDDEFTGLALDGASSHLVFCYEGAKCIKYESMILIPPSCVGKMYNYIRGTRRCTACQMNW